MPWITGNIDVSKFDADSDSISASRPELYKIAVAINDIANNSPSITGNTYTISAETATGGANLRLTGADASTDDVKFAEGTNINITRTDANVITIGTTATVANSFSTVSANGTAIVADSESDTLTLSPGTGIAIAGNASSDSITITNSGVTGLTAGSGITISGATGNVTITATANLANYVTTDTTQTITGDKTFSGTTSLETYKEQVYAAGNQTNYTPAASDGPVHTLTATGTLTLNAPSGMSTGGSIVLIIRQDGTGGRTLSANSAYKFAGGLKTLSTAANAIDVVTVFYDGTNYLASLTKGYQ
jgi:hypothetical protein